MGSEKPGTAIVTADDRELDWLERWYDDVRHGLPLLGTPDDAARVAGPGAGEDAARRLVSRYTGLSAAAGFLCGLPGYLSLPLTVPANVAGVFLLQLHMSQALALLHGLDPALEEVRDRCLRELVDVGRRPGGGESAARRRPADGVVDRVASKLGERAVRFLGEQAPRLVGRGGRSLPLLGGVVGGFADARSTADAGLRLRRALRTGTA